MIVGIDEVGRGAWAGPLVVGAVLLDDSTIQGLTDSKKLTRLQRETLDTEIRKKALGVGLGWVSAHHVDQIGLSNALKLASKRALVHIRQEYKKIIIDGTIRLIEDPRVITMKKADLLVPSVSAASIIAKVARDNYMRYVDTIFPGYKFATHVGYGTAAHQGAIRKLGVTPLHRLSYTPLHNKKVSRKFTPFHEIPLTAEQIIEAAENEVSNFLKRNGHTILERKWSTESCEIDIISQKKGTLYFTEVKYGSKNSTRETTISVRKRKQMMAATELFLDTQSSSNVILAVAHAVGAPPKVVQFLEFS